MQHNFFSSSFVFINRKFVFKVCVTTKSRTVMMMYFERNSKFNDNKKGGKETGVNCYL